MTSEYLRNQVKAGLLDEVPASRDLGLRILQTARTRLKDAGIVQASNETRFDCAYTCSRARIMLTANDVNAIPEPLLSRMFVFEIEAPSARVSAKSPVGSPTCPKANLVRQNQLTEALCESATSPEETPGLLEDTGVPHSQSVPSHQFPPHRPGNQRWLDIHP